MKARTDLVALIGRDLNLEPSGSVLKARSPKHRDTDPSFVVFPRTQTWHDFSGGGSGGGDCLDYLVQHRGLGFMEALRALAAETGDSGGVKLIHFGGLKLTHPYVQWPPV
jgi:DNA primase